MESTQLTPVKLFCPNCGNKVIGYKSDDGAVRITCSKCRVVIYSKPKNPKELAIRVISTKAI